MAYRNFGDDCVPELLPALGSRAEAPPRLSREEQHVVLISRCDRRGSLRKPGRMDRAIAWLFGIRQQNPLANPRWEALRRFSVLVRLDGRAADEERLRLFAAGFHPSVEDEVRSLILSARPASWA